MYQLHYSPPFSKFNPQFTHFLFSFYACSKLPPSLFEVLTQQHHVHFCIQALPLLTFQTYHLSCLKTVSVSNMPVPYSSNSVFAFSFLSPFFLIHCPFPTLLIYLLFKYFPPSKMILVRQGICTYRRIIFSLSLLITSCRQLLFRIIPLQSQIV